MDKEVKGELKAMWPAWINTTTLHGFDKEKLDKIFTEIAFKHPEARLNSIEEFLDNSPVWYNKGVVEQILEIASKYFRAKADRT